MNLYYVYIYFDLNNIPFYVGKGKDYRYNIRRHLDKSNRNDFLKNKIRKVGKTRVEIQFPYKDLTEEQAFYLEEYYIAGYGRRDKGLGTLCNLTNGGEGSPPHSEEIRQKISKMRKSKPSGMKGKKMPEEAKQKISKANMGERNGMYGKPLSKEHRCKISEANTGEKNPMYGKKFSEEHRCKISEGNKGKKMSTKTKCKISKATKGKNNPFYGKSHTKETKQKMSNAHKRRRNSK